MVRKSTVLWIACVWLVAAATCLGQAAKTGLTPEERGKIDAVAQEVLAKTGVPSASIAVVKNGQIAYLQAYGKARLQPETPARPDMRYSIGSISKQFTAAAILLLQEQGKLTLDDPVSRFVPNVTRARDVTIRQLLSHTSGYQDYWPQDYVMPTMLKPTTAEGILDGWARKPLDFEPGTKWQYSNTNFVLAGLIIEKASGMPFMQFLTTKILAPLDMKSVANIDQEKLTESDPTGYLRYALGPLRPAPKEGKGWLYAAGELAMTAQDLAKWDISLIDQKVLKPASSHEMETDVLLNNGLATGYGLGLMVSNQRGHRTLSHGGEVSGFTASNMVFPDDRAAVVVLTNQDAASAAGPIATRISELILAAPVNVQKQQQARKIFEGLQMGQIDRSLFTSNANAYFSEQAIQDFASSLGPLGAPQEFTQTTVQERGGMGFEAYRVKCGQRTLVVTVRDLPDGKIEQYQVAARE